MQKIGNILEDDKKNLFSKLKLGEHILTLKNLVKSINLISLTRILIISHISLLSFEA
jgi:hypothetical protein